MEMGKWKVYFIQYQGSQGRWFTKQPAYPTYESLAAPRRAVEDEGYLTRIVEQTTENRVM